MDGPGVAMEVIAHRGAHEHFPENSIEAFEEAIGLGADGIEFDVRLTKDAVPVVVHSVELHALGISANIFDIELDELRSEAAVGASSHQSVVPTLAEVLERFSGRTSLEFEIKSPEPETAEIVANHLRPFEEFWPSMEITSYEPAMLRELHGRCPGIALDLLTPRSEPWMTEEIVAHFALNRARLAGARAVHLQTSQLSPAGVDRIRDAGIEIHCWGVNDDADFESVVTFGIQKFDTDSLSKMLKLVRQGGRGA